MSISVVFVIKNGVKQGYPFWDSLLSCRQFADEIIISDGYSNDGTYDYLLKFKNKYSNVPIILYQDEWEKVSYFGEVIANVSNRAITRATKDWIYYLQADEIVHEDNISFIKGICNSGYNSVSFKFNHFIRSWQPKTSGYDVGYLEAIRMVRNGRDIRLRDDAWSFEGKLEPICPAENSSKPIYHFAYTFPKQSNIKDIEHSKLYQNIPMYRERAKKASMRLDTEIDPFPLTDFNDFPEVARRFIGKARYELPE